MIVNGAAVDRLVDTEPGIKAVIKMFVFCDTALPTVKVWLVLNEPGTINAVVGAPRIDWPEELKLTVRIPIGDLLIEAVAAIEVTP